MKYLSKCLKNVKSLKPPSYSKIHRILRLRKKWDNDSRGVRTDLANLAAIKVKLLNSVKSIGQSDARILKDGLTKISETVRNSRDKISEAKNKIKLAVDMVFTGGSSSKDAQHQNGVDLKQNLIMQDISKEKHIRQRDGKMKWNERKTRFTKRRRTNFDKYSNPPKVKNEYYPTVALVTSQSPNKGGLLMYNDQLGRSFCGHLKDLGDSEKLKEVFHDQEKNSVSDNKEYIHIPPGVKSKITIQITPSKDSNYSTIKYSELEMLPKEKENVQDSPSQSCNLSTFTEDVANTCTLPTIYSLATPKHLKRSFLVGVMSPMASVGGVNNSLKNLKKYWERIWDLKMGAAESAIPFTSSMAADTMALYIAGETNLKESLRFNNVSSRNIGTGGTSGNNSGKEPRKGPLVNKNKQNKSDKMKLSLPPQNEKSLDSDIKPNYPIVELSSPPSPASIEQTINLGPSKSDESERLQKSDIPYNVDDMMAEFESPNLMATSRTARHKEGGNKGKHKSSEFCKPKKKSSSGSGGGKPPMKRDICKPAKVPFGQAVKEFFTSSCFWLRNIGAINVLLAIMLGVTIYNALMPKEEEDEIAEIYAKHKDQANNKDKNGKSGSGKNASANASANAAASGKSASAKATTTTTTTTTTTSTKSINSKKVQDKIDQDLEKAKKEADKLCKEAEKVAKEAEKKAKAEKERLEKEAKKNLQ